MLYFRPFLPLPLTLMQFSVQIGSELVARGCVTADIAQCEFLQTILIQRFAAIFQRFDLHQGILPFLCHSRAEIQTLVAINKVVLGGK